MTLIGPQIRAARAFLGWSHSDLAEYSGISISTIKRFEGNQSVPRNRMNNLETIKQTLENHGIEFIGTENDGPGVMLHKIDK
jgi:transcriptional regulator with XRE-family HTH domain